MSSNVSLDGIKHWDVDVKKKILRELHFSVVGYRDSILVLQRSLDSTSIYGCTVNDGIDSITKKHTKGSGLLYPDDALAEREKTI